MTIADILQKSSFPKFPNTKEKFEWSTYSLNSLAIEKFDNFREVKLHRNFIIYVGGPGANEEEIQKYVEGSFSGIYYTDKNANKDYEKEFESKLADIRLFISYDGAFLMKSYQTTTVTKDEIAIFLEVPKDDVFSGNVLLVKAGENAIQYTEKILKHKWTQEKFTLSEDEIKSLLAAISTGKSFWDKVVATVNKIENEVVDTVTDLGVTVFKEIADFFGDTIRIDEKRWNSGHPEYSLEQIEKDVISFLNDQNREIDNFLQNKKNYIPDWVINIIRSPQKIISGILETIDEFKDDVENLWAFICGLWNGLMDLISGIFALLKLLFEGIKINNQYKQNEGYFKSLALEYLDNALQAMVNLDWKVVLKKGLVSYLELVNYLNIELPKELWDKAQTLNNTEINYYEGYIIFNILEFLLPPLKIAKLAEAGKLEKVIAVFEDIVAGITKVGNQVGKKADEVAEIFFRIVDDFIQILKKGTEDVSKFIDEIYQAIKKWLQETFGIGKKANKSNFDELYKQYGELIAKGAPLIKQKFTKQLEKIIQEAELPSVQRGFKDDLTKKKPKPSDETLYLKRRKQAHINFGKGDAFEDLFKKHNGGIKPDSSIKTAFTHRYVDNIKRNAARELKSGYIKMSKEFKKQVDKDIDILARKLEEEITKIEWHIVEGIDEACIKYMKTKARERNVLNQIVIILY